jgi:NAD(P)-dependent dehydrogenase (short-subunit alcohol dehydrogenase family)
MRLAGKIAIIAGAGQTPGETIGNGRATAIRFAREGAKLLLVDRDRGSAEETLSLVEAEGGEGAVCEADVSRIEDCEALVRACVERYGRVDILQNNVGIGVGDGGPTRVTEEAWDRIFDVNLKSQFLSAKFVLPVMREQGSGCITNISSVAALARTGNLAYKVSKAGVNALTQALAMGNAKYGIRVNAIMPGLMNTPMAIEGISKETGVDREALKEARDRAVPLRGKMGTAWDVANASLFLASDEAEFITGVLLPVDGGTLAKIG